MDLLLDAHDIHDQYQGRGFADRSDDEIFGVAARAVSVPKAEPADSFILHAPLELLARRALLEFAPPAQRDAIRERMLWVAATYERAAAPAEPAATRSFASVPEARAAVATAIDDRDLDGVDAAAVWLSEHASTDAVVGLAPAVIDSLAAAGHASIYFTLLPRVAPRSRSALALLRPLLREVARLPGLRIEWIRDGVRRSAQNGHALAVALGRTPRLGLPGSNFIFPLVHQVDPSGIARDIVGPNLPESDDDAAKSILRVAALSMLQDDPSAAPYGWSHCLTLPQGVLGVAPRLRDPAVGIAIAATYVVGFRAGEARVEIEGEYEPAPTHTDAVEALAAEPTLAAAAAYHASGNDRARLVAQLAGRAGSHEDAHLAKYTLACFDAAGRDPDRRRLYTAAAAYLCAWWQQAATTSP